MRLVMQTAIRRLVSCPASILSVEDAHAMAGQSAV